MKEKLFKIAKIMVNDKIKAYNFYHACPEKRISNLESVINETEKEILIRPCTSKYMFYVDEFVKIAEAVHANYYIDVTKNILDEPAACFVIYF